MPLYRVTLAYDGTGFRGFQLQKRGGRTVQGAVEDALARLAGGARVAVAGAGRTDAGVHALGQVAAFELARELEPEALRRALNGLLPRDVRVLDAARAASGFHPRKSAVSKLYRYTLDCGGVQPPQRARFAGARPPDARRGRRQGRGGALRGPPRLRVARLERLLGRHHGAQVTRSEAVFDAGTLVYEVEADGFLRKMVRSMVGGLIAAGSGAMGIAELAKALAARDRSAWPRPAEARGLTLVRVDYPPESGRS